MNTNLVSDIERNECPTLTVGIPADRTIEWAGRIIANLGSIDSSVAHVDVMVARWQGQPVTDQDMENLNAYYPAKEILSPVRHAPAMRNAIVRETTSSHVLFLDDDMVPGQDLLNCAFDVAAREPDTVHQGIPYRVANTGSWLARSEGRLYERGFERYINKDDTVTLLDARLLLAPTSTLRETPFNEDLGFSTAEGGELARSLLEKGVVLRLARELNAAHINRDTVASLAKQKRAHGLGRGYELLNHGPGDDGWLSYIASYADRHYAKPAFMAAKGEINPDEMLYAWGTNTAMWAGVFEYMLSSNFRSDSEG